MNSVKVDEKDNSQELSIESHVLPNLDYKPKTLQSSKYKYFGLSPDTQPNFGLNAAAVTQSRFSIPRSNVYLFARSSIVFDLAFVAAGATLYNRCMVDRPPISTMRLFTRSGIDLLNIDNFGYYWKMTRCQTPKNVYLNNGVMGVAADPGAAAAGGNLCSFHNPGKDAVIGILNANNTRFSTAAAPASLTLPSANAISQQVVATSAADGAMGMRCRIQFGQLNGTILACPKDLPCTEDLILEIGWAPTSTFTFVNTTGAADFGAALAAYAPAAGGATINNLKINLCVEADTLIQSKLNEDVLTKGIDIPFPFSRVINKDLVAANSTKNSNMVITSQIGANLLRVMSCEFNPSEEKSTSHQASNIAGARTASIKISVNGNDLDGTLTTSSQEDYSAQSKLLSNSACDASDFYSVCPVTITSFAGDPADLTSSGFDDFDKIYGTDLGSNSVQYARTVNCILPSNVMMLAQGQKYLNISNGSMKLTA